MKRTKSFPITEFKALPSEGEGVFSAYVSIFGNVDLVGDRVLPGAFTESLAKWRESGDPIPIIFNHDWGNLESHIGWADPNDVIEDDKGLLIKRGVLDVADEPIAGRAWTLMKSRRLKEFSFAYDIEEERKAKDGANDLVTLDLIEAGPTLKGANPETELVDVKTRKRGRADGAKADVELAGSYEDRQDEVQEAVTRWALDQWGYDLCIAVIEATWDDRVVVYVEMWEDPWGGGDYFEMPYTVLPGGDVELGEASQVDIVATTIPAVDADAGKSRARKARRLVRGVKEGRRNSTADAELIQSIHDTTVELGSSCPGSGDGQTSSGTASTDARGKREDRHGGKREDPLGDLEAFELEIEAARLSA